MDDKEFLEEFRKSIDPTKMDSKDLIDKIREAMNLIAELAVELDHATRVTIKITGKEKTIEIEPLGLREKLQNGK